ncbi:MAG: aminotransferase class V-fold PLP-dependent enzyme [Gammaproteobacteria bacterium]
MRATGLTSWRQHFNVPSGAYLLAHSVGCQPVAVKNAISEFFLTPWWQSGGDAWPQWMETIAQFNSQLAKIFNGRASDFCPQVNLSSTLTKILSSLPARPGRDVIVLSELDFPSIGFVAQQAKRNGYRLRFIDRSQNVTDPQVWDDAFDAQAQIALITHVLSNDGRCLPVTEICRAARESDIYSAVDIAQSAGVVPVDLNQWQADFVYGSCVKWLCGGPGAAFCWISNHIVETLEPLDVGWFSHRDPFEFDIHHFEYSPDARRFMGGTPSILPFVVANVGLSLIDEIGVSAIGRHNQKLLDQLCANVPLELVCSPTGDSPRGGTAVLNPSDRSRFSLALTEAEVAFDERASGFRFSPHIYSSFEDINTLIHCVNEVI